MVKLKLDVDPELPGRGDDDGDDDDADGDDAEHDDTDNNSNSSIVRSIDINNPTLIDVMVVDEDMDIALNDDTEQDDIDFVGENSTTQVVIEDLESGKTVETMDSIDCRRHSTPFRRLLQQIRFRAIKDPSSTDPPKDRNDDDDDTNSVRTDTTEATAIMIMRPSASTETENTIAPESLVDDEVMEMNSNSNLSNQVAVNRSNGGYDDDNFRIVIPGPNSSLRVSSPAHSYLFGRNSNSRMGSCRPSSCCAIIMCIIACCAAGLIVVYFASLPNEIDA
mmetsp:Transcript_4715/g.12007  ORF Transcript_4715/g.12007 Transcript_4715/m.12007 type:complete len:278 (+) Transcript_4715:177-1010(+)